MNRTDGMEKKSQCQMLNFPASIPISPSKCVEMKSSTQHSPAHFAEICLYPGPPSLTESLPHGFCSGPPHSSSHQELFQASVHPHSQTCISEASQASPGGSVALTFLYLPNPFPHPPWLPAKLHSQPLLQLDGTM